MQKKQIFTQKDNLISRLLTCIQKVCKKQKFTQKYDLISRIVTCIQKVCKKNKNSRKQSCLIVCVVNFTFVGKRFRFAPSFNNQKNKKNH